MSKRIVLSEEDVVVVTDQSQNFSRNTTARILEINEALKTELLGIYSAWSGEGVECRALREIGGWQEGKIRIQVQFEFIADEPDLTGETTSPLADLRSSLEFK